MRRLVALVSLAMMVFLPGCAHTRALPSWENTAAKDQIMDFVQDVQRPHSSAYVDPELRVAVFDNDGTLWSEQPMYVQLQFALDRVRAMAPDHPEWRTTEPFRSVLENDTEGIEAAGMEGLMMIIGASHAGMTTVEFEESVTEWLETARHPKTGRLYTEMVYQPMLELIDYLHDSDFKVFIVSGGGIEFMRPWTYQTYGIPPERVVGSSLKLKYEMRNGDPVIVKLPEIDLIDDKAGKPVGIESHIGLRPVFAGGNSDGDYEMLEYTTVNNSPAMGIIIHHDDAVREVAYDRDSHIGRLARALDDAPSRGWLVVSMKDDWKVIFPPEKKRR